VTELTDLYRSTITALAEAVASGTITPLQILESQLERIAEREPQVQAWAWHDPQQVLAQLRGLTQAQLRQPLAGVAIGIKDIIDTADMPTAYGSEAYFGHRPTTDAVVIAKLKAAGALLMGKTVTTEFAHVYAGPTVNPHNFLHTPGGSSSGSAAAVADGMVALALGSQTGGSTIRPAAYCGVVGFKPTYGRISLEGVMPLSAEMDTMGLMARSVDDIILLAQVLLEPFLMPPVSDQKPVFAWYPGPNVDEVEPESVKLLERARAQLIEHGAQFVEINLPRDLFANVGDANRLIMAYQAGHHHASLYRNRPDKLGATTRHLIESGLAMPPEVFAEQISIAARGREIFQDAMRGIDALLTFSAPGTAPLVQEGTGASTFNRIWTTIGAPCLTLPAGRGINGLPLGVQFVARHDRDASLLQLGRRFESIFTA
jgi:Asp-tRNA(Asn)/Glu-tRNA(Gln) amidotransferase A subunit family amidase